MIVETMQVCDLLDDEADAIVAHLTNAGSEFREEVATRKTRDHRTPISLVIEEGTLVAWACSHQWRGMQTLEMFTAASQRRRRLATIATTVLVASSQFDFCERRVVEPSEALEAGRDGKLTAVNGVGAGQQMSQIAPVAQQGGYVVVVFEFHPVDQGSHLAGAQIIQ